MITELIGIHTEELHDVRETLCYGLDEESKVDKKCRDLFQLSINLANFTSMSTSIGKINLTGLGNGWDLLKLLLVEMVHPLERMIKHFTFLPISSEQQHYIYPVPQPPGQLDMCFQFMLSRFETQWAWVWESMVWREEKQSTLLWLSSHTTLSLLTDGYRYLSKNIYSIFGLFTCEWV